MAEKESLNFYKLSTLLVDKVKGVFSKRIQLECNNNLESFEDFLNRTKNKDDLFHMWRSVRCCNPHCNKSKTKKLLYDVQWNQLYMNTSAIHAGHVKRDSRGWICQECTCVYNAHKSILSDSLDVTLASCILLNLCSLSPTEKKSIENLRGMRNSVFAHAQNATISDADFPMHWATIEKDVICLSSLLNCVTQNKIKEELDSLHQTPFVDKDTLQALVNNILNQQGKDTCISEKLEEIAGCESCILQKLGELEDGSYLDGSSQRKVQKITAAEADISDFIPTKGLEKGITSIKTNGVAIFTGVCGCGKSTNSIEILRRVEAGEIFQDLHYIQHINIDNWDSQVDIDKNTVVFLEDPLGTTNANTALTEHDNGTFRKIWTCIQKGKVKVLITVRSNILCQSQQFLRRHDIFDDKYVINLSEGDCALDGEEKRQIVQLYCNKYNVRIQQTNVEKVDDINLEFGSSIPLKVNYSTIKQILDSDPQIGFPLCCRYFFENPKNISLGARYFLQPSEILLNEINNLAVSENKNETLQFAILIHILMNNGKIDVDKIEQETFDEILKALALSEIADFHIRISVDKLNNRFICRCCGYKNAYEFLHNTVLESVFIIATEKVPILISILLSKANIKVICEVVRTGGIVGKENEIIVQIAEKDYKFLAERFVKEVRERNFSQIIAHSSMSDISFSSVLLNKLKEYPDIFYEQNDYGYTLFQMACLYDKVDLVERLIKNGLVQSGIIREGVMTCIKFDNIRTFESIIPNIIPEHLREAFRGSCKRGKTKMVQSVITLAHEDLLPENLQQGFQLACAYGDVKLVQDILKCDMENGIYKGLEEACKKGHIQIVKMLLEEHNDLTDDQVASCFVKACEHGYAHTAIFMVSFVPFSHLNKALVDALGCCNRKTFRSLIKNANVFSDDNMRQCLLTLCENENNLSTKTSSKCDFTFSVSGESCTPFPMSIQTKSTSVPIYTPATGNVNLFPQIKYKTSDIENPNIIPRSQIRALMVKSILEFRQKFPNDYIREVIIKASKHGCIEILSVLLPEIERTESAMTVILQLIVESIENDHPETLQFLLSHSGHLLTEYRYIISAVCKKDDVTFLKIACDTLQISVKNNEEILQISCEYESLNVIGYVLDTNPEMPLEAILNVWNKISENARVNSAQCLLTKRADIPYEHIEASLFQACYNNNIDFIAQILAQRPNIPFAESVELAKYAYQLKQFDVFEFIIKNCILLSGDALNLLPVVLEAYDFHFFDIIVNQYPTIDLMEIGKIISDKFKTKYSEDILEVFSKIYTDLTKDEIESAIIQGFQNKAHIESTQQSILKAISKNDTAEIRKITEGIKYHSSKDLVNALNLACRHNKDIFGKLLDLAPKLNDGELFSVFIETCKFGKLNHIEIFLNFCSHLRNEQICKGLVEICRRDFSTLSISDRDQYSCKIVKSVFAKTPALTKCQISIVFLVALEQKQNQICNLIIKSGKLRVGDVKNWLPLLPSSLHIFKRQQGPSIHETGSTAGSRSNNIAKNIFQCLLKETGSIKPEKDIIKMFVQLLPSPLTTDQIHQCLLSHCTGGNPDKSIIEMFVQLLPSPLTTNQIHQCLLSLCTRDTRDKSIIEMFVQLLPSPLTTDQIHQCLLSHCTGGNPDKSIIKMFVQLLPSPLTTDQIHQCLLSHCTGGNPDKSIIEMFVQLLPSPLTTNQIHQCLLPLCTRDTRDKSIIEMFVQLLPSPLTTYQVHQCLLSLFERYKQDKSIIQMFVQLLPSPLTTDQIHQCLLSLCKGYEPDKSIIEMFVQLLPLPLTTDQIHQCLLPLCTRYKQHKSIIEMFVQLLPSPLTTDQIQQCLLPLCERYSDTSIIEIFVQLSPSPLTTDQIHQCLLTHCTRYKQDKSIIEMFVQLLPSPLTTDHIHQCLLTLCTRYKQDKSIIEMFVQLLPSPLTTDHIHQCLLSLCEGDKPDTSIIEMFVQLLPLPLTTDQIHQCLLPLCERYSDKYIIEIFVQLSPSPLTTDQIHQCLLTLCTRYKQDKSIIEMFVHLLPSPLTTDQIRQCLLSLCKEAKPDKSIIEMFVQLLPSPLTTDQIHQCLLSLCKEAKPDKSIIEMFVQLLPSALTTDQIYQCLLSLCTRSTLDKSIIEMFVQLLPSPLTTDQIQQCLLPLCTRSTLDKSIIEMFVQLLPSPLTTDQIHQCLLPLCTRYGPDKSIIEMFAQLLSSPLTTDQIYQCVLPLCEQYQPDKYIIEIFVQLSPSPLTTDQIHQCLLTLCTRSTLDKSIIEMFVQLLPSPLTTYQVHQCLLSLFERNRQNKSIIQMFVQLLPSPLTTDQIHQCLLSLCKNYPDKSIIEMFVQLLPSPLTTDQIHQCLLPLCKNYPDKSIIEMFVQLLSSPLTTYQVHQCLLSLFERYRENKSIIEMFIQLLPSPLTTDKIHQYLLTLCERYRPDRSIIKMFVQLSPSPLTTDQIHQCLLPLCKGNEPDKYIIEIFVQLSPSPLTTDQIHQCVLTLCTRYKQDKSIIETFVQLLPSPLTTDQIYQCLLSLCQGYGPDKSIIETFVQLLPSPLTTDQIYQYLLKLLSSNNPDKSSVEIFLQKGNDLTTDQIYAGLTKYVERDIRSDNLNPIIIEAILTQRSDLTAEMVTQSVLTLLKNVSCYNFDKCVGTLDIILKIRTELTLEEIKKLYDAFYRSFELENQSDRIKTLTSKIARTRPDFISHINGS